MTRIAGRHVLVTGGASGIGRLVALRMAALGGRVGVWDLRREPLDAVVAEIGKTGPERSQSPWVRWTASASNSASRGFSFRAIRPQSWQASCRGSSATTCAAPRSAWRRLDRSSRFD